MNPKDYLKSNECTDLSIKFRKELQLMTASTFINRLFSKNKLNANVAQKALQLLKKPNDYYPPQVSLGSEELTDFKSWINENTWEDKAYYQLLIYFFGNEIAPLVKDAWKKIPFRMYQTGYTRRSFRAPNHEQYLLVSRVNFLRSVLLFATNNEYGDMRRYYQLSLLDQVRLDNYLEQNPHQFMVWAAALDRGDEKLFKLFEDIIYNNEAVGKVTRNVIKALLFTNREDCWILVEKLLLSAQRQEGLRQTILESLDETSHGALRHMIKVILEHKLTRFSSVVRAIDTWTGMGWSAEKESTVKTILQYADDFLSQPELIPNAIQSNNNVEVYMALWSLAVVDMQKTAPYLNDLLINGNIEKKYLSIFFASHLEDPYIEMPLLFKSLDYNELQLFSFSLPRLNQYLSANQENKVYVNHVDYPNFYEKLLHYGDHIETKKKKFNGKVFNWLNTTFEREQLYSCALLLIGDDTKRLHQICDRIEHFSVTLRESLIKTVLKDYYEMQFTYYRERKKAPGKPSEFQKKLALELMADRSDSIVSIAFETLKMDSLTQEDWQHLLPLYQRKSSKLKQYLTELMLKRKDADIEDSIQYLLLEGSSEQRFSALDLMLQLKRQNRMIRFITLQFEELDNLEKLSERERTLINQLKPEVKLEELTLENGFGFYNPQKVSPYELPKPTKGGIFETNYAQNNYGFSKPMSEIRSHLKSLFELYNKHVDFEYEIEHYNGSKETVLLGNTFQRSIYRVDENWTNERKYSCYPLHEVWELWFVESGLQPVDLSLLTFVEDCHYDEFKSWLKKHVFYFKKDIIAPFSGKFRYWNNPILQILNALKIRFPFEQRTDFLLDATANIYNELPSHFLNYKYEPKDNYWYTNTNGNGWQSAGVFDIFLVELNLQELNDVQIEKAWMLYRWRQFSGLKENTFFSRPPLYLYCRMFDLKKISEQEFYEGLIDEENLRTVTVDPKNKYRNAINYRKSFPWLEEFVERVQRKFLAIELKRGDSATSVTNLVVSFQTIYGIDRFANLVHGLGKLNLYRGYVYSWGSQEVSRQQSFSYLLKRSFPRETDKQEDFNQLMEQYRFSDKRLIEAAIYAPQWQPFISNFLGWNGLDAGIWWMHAHTKTPSYVAINAELESEIAKYSELDVTDFQNGAVDKEWFQIAYKKLGKAKWELLHKAAKYISEGNGHRRALLYSKTLTGNLKITEVTKKVKDKRDQDYLRVFGLVPLSRANPENDVLKRYEYMLQFKKESKSFGTMRQSSEALAVQVALENLARNAGYPDPIRLTWAMETKQVQKIFEKDTKLIIADYKLALIINDEGKTNIKIKNKDGKVLKSLPAKLKKDKKYLELSEHRKILNEQYRRSKKSLEEAMVRGDSFSATEISTLANHPVIQKHLTNLVLIASDDTLVWLNEGKLKSLNSNLFEIQTDHTYRIAHVVDFHRLNQWLDFQRFCFENKIKQPFKQVFRELYVPTADELKEKSISRRYAGHQVQPSQTLALLRGRGWKVDYEDGLQKVFHKEGFLVKLYAMANWFSPADVEAPVLETVEFHSVKDYKNIAFEEIEPRIFSEVMRDVDLVVSVAHVGGVDPETSQSTVEMRAALVRETMRLFKQENVTLSERHAHIAGTMSKYSVHLGSAVVHQVPGKHLSILPVHSQHRGRLFLPFADDDPKSAEVLSKVLLLAKDDKIQDPTILSRIEV